jgi:hypothetical protein
MPPRPTVFELGGDHLIARRYRYWNADDGALVDPDLDDTEGEDSFLEFGDWLVESGELDHLVAQGDVGADIAVRIRDLQMQGRAARGLTRPAVPSSRPVLERSVIELLDAAAEPQRPVGFIGAEQGEVAWRIIPHMVLGRRKEGVVVLAAAVGVVGRTADSFEYIFGKETVEAIGRFLADQDQRTWRHPRGAISLERVDSDRDRLTFVLKRTRPPGGHVPVQLGPAASARLRDALQSLVAGEWGTLRSGQG